VLFINFIEMERSDASSYLIIVIFFLLDSYILLYIYLMIIEIHVIKIHQNFFFDKAEYVL